MRRGRRHAERHRHAAPAPLRGDRADGARRRRRAVRLAAGRGRRHACSCEDRNRVAGGDHTRHPEFEIARWAAAQPDARGAAAGDRLYLGRALPDVRRRARLGRARAHRLRAPRRRSSSNGWPSSGCRRGRCGRCRSKRSSATRSSTGRRRSSRRRSAALHRRLHRRRLSCGRAMPLALRLALRELRGGLAGFRVFLACLALGVAAIAAVGSVRAAIEPGLAREAAALLGGDAEIEFTYRFADPDERAWMDGARARGLRDRRLPLAGRPAGRRRARRWSRSRPSTAPTRSTAASRSPAAAASPTRSAPRDGLPGLVAERVARRPARPRARRRGAARHPRLPPRRHARRRARRRRRRLRLRAAGDRAARRPRRQRAAGRGLALRQLLPPAARARRRPRGAEADAEARFADTRAAVARPPRRRRPGSAASSTGSAPS